MLTPRHKAFVTGGTKEQTAQIAKEKNCWWLMS